MPKDRFLGLKVVQRKWILYALVMILAHILQSGEIMPLFFHSRPLLVISAAVTIAMLEGEIGGGIIGAAAGILIDINHQSLPGFYSICLLICCAGVGLLVRYLMRNNLVTALLLDAATLVITKVLYWFFFYFFVGNPESSYIFIWRVLPEMIYTLICVIPFYYITRSVKIRYERIAD